MRGGWTLTCQVLTYDDREPDAYDIAADEVDPREKWVLRRYDVIVQTFDVGLFGTAPGEVLMRKLGEQGTWPDMHIDWHEWVLYADTLTARILTQQETLPIAV